jgi:multidrug resistance efflux pump
MEILLILIYAALCIAIFKIFSIPVNKWTLPTAALGGIIMIGFILLVMNYNHPFSANARIYFATTPIMPNVKGRVIEVPVEANAPLKQGDVLFRIDPSPYQFKVDKGRAALAEAEQNVGQLKAGFESAQAKVDEATAQRDRAKGSYERYSQGNENARMGGRDLPFSLAEIENRRTTYLAAEGALQAAVSKAEQARVIYQSEIGGVHTAVASLRAELQEAEFDLENTTVRAPGPGFVTQMALRPGMYVVPAPLRPVMVFVHQADRALAAAFRQNALQRLRVGDEAEIAFDVVPGRIFKGKVQIVVDAIALGQLQATGSLQDLGEPLPGGRAIAIIEIDEDSSAYNIPGGAAAQVAVYTPYWHGFSILRRILLRMRSWENYVFLEGHGGGNSSEPSGKHH